MAIVGLFHFAMCSTITVFAICDEKTPSTHLKEDATRANGRHGWKDGEIMTEGRRVKIWR